MSLAEIPPFTDSSPAVLRTAAENVEPRTMADDDREHDSHTHNEKNCRHCGLPLPPSDHAVTEEHAFCCAGCKTAFALISSEGLNEYYALRQRFADGKTQAVSPELIDASLSTWTRRDFGNITFFAYLTVVLKSCCDCKEFTARLVFGCSNGFHRSNMR